MKIAIFTFQVGHYHEAKFSYASKLFSDFNVISFVNDADFQEFLSSKHTSFPVHKLYQGQAEYDKAVIEKQLCADVFSLLDKLNPDVVGVAGWASPESFAGIIWAKKRSRAIVMFSDSQRIDAKRNIVKEWIKSRVLRNCDAALVAGTAHKSYLADLGFEPTKISLGYDAVDNLHFAKGAAYARKIQSKMREKYSLPKKYFLASGRFIDKKNFGHLIEAYAEAKLRNDKIPKLIILGDGPNRLALEEKVACLGLMKNVFLPGFQDYHDLPIYYGLAKAFIHVATSEQWGLVINEAAASGLPILASNECGATVELIKNGKNGYSIAARDKIALVQRLVDLASLSETECEQMGVQSQETVSKWGVDRYAQGLNESASRAYSGKRSNTRLHDRFLLRMMCHKKVSGVS